MAGALGDPERHLDDLAHHYWHSDDDDAKRRLAAPSRRRRPDGLRQRRRAASTTGDCSRCCPSPSRSSRWSGSARSSSSRRTGRRPRSPSPARSRSPTRGRRPRQPRVGPDLAGRGGPQAGPLRRGRAGLAEAPRCSPRSSDDAAPAQVLHLSGTLAAQQGELRRRARATTSGAWRSARRLGDRSGMAALFSNLAIVAEYEGDYDAGRGAGGTGAGAAPRARRPLGHRHLAEQPRHAGHAARRPARGADRASASRWPCTPRSATPGWWRWATTTSATPPATSASTTRPAPPTRRRSRPTAATATSGCSAHPPRGRRAALSRPLGRPDDAWRLVGASDALHERVGSPRTPDVAARLGEALDQPTEAAALDVDALRREGAGLDDAALDRLLDPR